MPPSSSPPTPTRSPPVPQGPHLPFPTPSARAAHPPRRPRQTQPTTVKLSPAGLRTLPYRLTHPPPLPQHVAETSTQGKARWWRWPTIQPRFDVRLDDVLERKYLPPLGLKDFEEWLIFVDGKEEKLYFILWLREYTTQYNAWMASFKGKTPMTPTPHGLSFTTPSDQDPLPREQPFASLGLAASTLATSPAQPGTSRGPRRTEEGFDSEGEEEEHHSHRSYASTTPAFPPPNPALSMFYLRAKVTFLTPGAPYELADVSTDVLSVFHTGQANTSSAHASSSSGPYGPLRNLSSSPGPRPPDPAVFAELKDIVECQLQDSLQRLVVATYNNVGMQRAYCGNAGGVAIGAALSAPPLAASFSLHAARWWRILALPGMWLGLTIFISAMYGVCMMIYIFGDLRQLRSFELLRPPIKVIVPSGEPGNEKSLPGERRGSIRSNITMPSAKARDDPPPSPSRSILAARKMSMPLAFPLKSLNASRKMSMPTTSAERSNVEATSGGLSNEEIERIRADWNRPLTRPPALKINTSPSRIRQPLREVSRQSEPAEEHTGSPGLRPEPPSPLPRVHLEDDNHSVSSDEGYTSSSSLSSVPSEESDVAPSDTRFSPRHQHRRRRDRSRRPRRPPRIEISDAIVEEHPSPEGPATAPEVLWPSTSNNAPTRVADPLWPDYVPPSSAGHDQYDQEGQTAAFIQPFWDDEAIERDARARAESLRRGSQDVEKGVGNTSAQAHAGATAAQARPAFDFDGLPQRRRFGRRGGQDPQQRWWTPWTRRNVPPAPPPASAPIPPTTPLAPNTRRPPTPSSASDVGSAIAGRGTTCVVRTWWKLLERMQSHCSPENAADVLQKQPQDSTQSPGTPRTPQATTFAVPQPTQQREAAQPATWKTKWSLGLRRGYLAAPAFAAPLTPVLDPLVGRAQWEIVVRSAIVSAIISVLVVAGIVGIPE